MTKFNLIFFFIFLLIINTVLGAGTVTLYKDVYHPLETALVCGTCTVVEQENLVGFYTWRQKNGTLLRNQSVNTGLCRTSLFCDQFTFPVNSNYLFNVTFRQSSTYWEPRSNSVTDRANVSGPSPYDCIILFENNTNNFFLGQDATFEIQVLNANTYLPTVHAECELLVYDNFDNVLLAIPDPGIDWQTSAYGKMVFTFPLTKPPFELGETYRAKAYCYCLNSSTDEQCYYLSNSTRNEEAGFLQCTARRQFTISGLITQDTPGDCCTDFIHLAVYIIMIGLSLGFMVLMLYNQDDLGSSIVFGVVSATFGIIMASMILFGYKIVNTNIVILFDVNYYLALIPLALSIYQLYASYALYKTGKDRRQEHNKPKEY